MQYIQTLALLASTVSALSVTAPAQGASVSQADQLAITWNTVSSDSTPFSVQVALSTNSAQQTTVATNVQPSAGGVTVPASQLQPGNYTVNLVATGPNNSGILAQSGYFLITAAAVSSSASSGAAGAVTSSSSASSAAATDSASSAVSSASSSAASGAASGARPRLVLQVR